MIFLLILFVLAILGGPILVKGLGALFEKVGLSFGGYGNIGDSWIDKLRDKLGLIEDYASGNSNNTNNTSNNNNSSSGNSNTNNFGNVWSNITGWAQNIPNSLQNLGGNLKLI